MKSYTFFTVIHTFYQLVVIFSPRVVIHIFLWSSKMIRLVWVFLDWSEIVQTFLTWFEEDSRGSGHVNVSVGGIVDLNWIQLGRCV